MLILYNSLLINIQKYLSYRIRSTLKMQFQIDLIFYESISLSFSYKIIDHKSND